MVLARTDRTANRLQAAERALVGEQGLAARVLVYFGGRTVAEAARQAAAMLSGPPGCSCCPSRLGHIHLRLGTTFFFDDNPEQLVRAFPAAERAFFTPALLAACILLTGRRRVDARQ
jgi:hypothetical protein